MDNRLGGGKLRSTIVSYLDDHVSRLLTTGSYQEETGRQLAAACGELSQLAGWVAYDSDEHGLAQRYLTQALAYARHAGKPDTRTGRPTRHRSARFLALQDGEPQVNGPASAFEQLAGHHHALDLVGALVDLGNFAGRPG
jgi:hypothetical protein